MKLAGIVASQGEGSTLYAMSSNTMRGIYVEWEGGVVRDSPQSRRIRQGLDEADHYNLACLLVYNVSAYAGWCKDHGQRGTSDPLLGYIMLS